MEECIAELKKSAMTHRLNPALTNKFRNPTKELNHQTENNPNIMDILNKLKFYRCEENKKKNENTYLLINSKLKHNARCYSVSKQGKTSQTGNIELLEMRNSCNTQRLKVPISCRVPIKLGHNEKNLTNQRNSINLRKLKNPLIPSYSFDKHINCNAPIPDTKYVY